MRKTKSIMMLLAVMGLGCLAACSSPVAESGKDSSSAEPVAVVDTAQTSSPDRETLFQVSLLQGLTLGDYFGSVPVSTLKQKGDIGLGTFDALNGELVMVDGIVYRAAGDGTVEVVPDDELIPFADVTCFDADEVQTVENISNYDALRELLNAKVSSAGGNRFYVIRIDGTFREMNVRSEYRQEKPYQPLADVLEHDQTFYDYENITGTVVGLYCPPYMDRLNATGWHLHFISADRTKGGHVLGLNIDSATLSYDCTDGFQMLLPETGMFAGFDLTVDQSEDIEKVETNVERNS